MSDIDKVRLLIADTGSTQYTDAQIQAFLDMGGDVYIAAALALEAWAASITGNATAEKIGDYSYSKKESDNKLALAQRYRDTSGETPAMDWAEMDLVDLPETIEESE